MTKTDASTNAALAGATFTVVRADNKEDAQDFVEANAAYFNNSASGGTVTNLTSSKAAFVTGDTSGNANTSATAPVTFTTGKDGIATFNGFNLIDITQMAVTQRITILSKLPLQQVINFLVLLQQLT